MDGSPNPAPANKKGRLSPPTPKTSLDTKFHTLPAKKLLIIDDFGMTPMDEATRDDFFSFIDERGQAGGSLIIASQRGFADWYSYIGDKYHADAILDRLKNRSYFIELKGRSYRERTKEAKKVRAAE